MARGFAVLLLAVGAAAAARGQTEVPLASLTPKQVADRLQQAFTDPNYKGSIQNWLKTDIPGFKVDPAAVGFVGPDGKAAAKFVPGQTKLVWRYAAAAPLDAAQKQKADEAMQKTLSEVLLQYRGPKGDESGLVSAADWQVLSKGLAFEPAAPAVTTNTPPTITAVADVRVAAGAVARVRFTVGDAETRPADLRVTSAASNPAVLPPAHQVITPVPGQDGGRQLEMVTTEGQPGTVRVTLTVTDAGGLTASTGFTLTVALAGGTESVPVIQSRPEPPPAPGGTGSGSGAFGGAGAAGYASAVAPWYGTGAGYGYPAVAPYPAGPYFPTAVTPGYSGGWCGRCCGRSWAPAVCAFPPIGCPPFYPSAPAYCPAAVAAPAAGGHVAAPPAAPAGTTAHVTARVEAAAPVSRTELVKGKGADDAAGLYGSGYAAYWDGRYADAVEYCAAAAELADDPRAWYYLGFASAALGDADAARAAIRYAAARTRVEPGRERDVNLSLGRIQGADRARLGGFQEEVRTEAGMRAALASRPDLRQPVRSSPTLTATRPAQR